MKELKLIKEGKKSKDKIIIFLSLVKIFFLRMMFNKYPYWIKLISKVDIKDFSNIKYYGELITLSGFHENRKYLNVLLDKKYKYLLDIGGHTGRISFIFLNKNKDTKVVYVEPNPYSFSIFEELISKDKTLMKRAILINKAISYNSKKKINFYLSSKYGGCSSIIRPKRYYKKILVDTTSIDDLMKKINLKDIDLIKIDVEGHEIEVLKGMKNFLQRKENIDMLVEINNKKNKYKFIKELKRQNLKFKITKIDKVDYLIKIKGVQKR